MESLRCGKKWLNEEDEQLKELVNNNKSFEEIALHHKRTVKAIKCRVVSHIIYPIYKDNKDNDNILNELSLKYNIEKFYIENYINKINTNDLIKMSIEKNKNENSIEFRLNKIEEKLNYIIEIISK